MTKNVFFFLYILMRFFLCICMPATNVTSFYALLAMCVFEFNMQNRFISLPLSSVAAAAAALTATEKNLYFFLHSNNGKSLHCFESCALLCSKLFFLFCSFLVLFFLILQYGSINVLRHKYINVKIHIYKQMETYTNSSNIFFASILFRLFVSKLQNIVNMLWLCCRFWIYRTITQIIINRIMYTLH